MLVRGVSEHVFREHICGLPFALSVHLVLGERDVLVIKVDTQFCSNLSQVLIGSPLFESNT